MTAAKFKISEALKRKHNRIERDVQFFNWFKLIETITRIEEKSPLSANDELQILLRSH